MYARYLNAPLLLLLWQVAPVDLKTDREGRVRVSFGVGRGHYTFRDFPGYPGGVDCTGQSYPGRAPFTEPDSYSSAGVAVEAWPSKTVRVQGAFGNISRGTVEQQAFGAAQVALEEKYFGIGLGFAALGGTEGTLRPSASARVGLLSGVSLRADYRRPDAAMGLIGGPRIGLGLNQGQSRKGRLLVGMATTPVPDSARKAGGFLEVAVPLKLFHNKFGLSLTGFFGGSYHGNEDKPIYALGLGGWIQP